MTTSPRSPIGTPLLSSPVPSKTATGLPSGFQSEQELPSDLASQVQALEEKLRRSQQQQQAEQAARILAERKFQRAEKLLATERQKQHTNVQRTAESLRSLADQLMGGSLAVAPPEEASTRPGSSSSSTAGLQMLPHVKDGSGGGGRSGTMLFGSAIGTGMGGPSMAELICAGKIVPRML